MTAEHNDAYAARLTVPMTKRMPFDMGALGQRHKCRRSGPVKVRQATASERVAFGIKEPRQH